MGDLSGGGRSLGTLTVIRNTLESDSLKAVKRRQSAAAELRALRRMQSVVLDGSGQPVCTTVDANTELPGLPPLQPEPASPPLGTLVGTDAQVDEEQQEDEDSVYQPPTPPRVGAPRSGGWRQTRLHALNYALKNTVKHRLFYYYFSAGIAAT